MRSVFDLWRNKLEKPLELLEAQPDDCDYEQLIPPIFNHSTNTRPPKCSNVNIIIRMKHPQIKALNSNDQRFEFTSLIPYPLFLKVVKIFNYLWMKITRMKKRQMFRIKNNWVYSTKCFQLNTEMELCVLFFGVNKGANQTQISRMSKEVDGTFPHHEKRPESVMR